MPQLFKDFDQQGPMAQVREGMTVYDRAEKRVGKVKEVHLGEGNPMAQDSGLAPATAGETGTRDESVLESLGEALAPRDDVPENARDGLLRVGYIAIDAAGIFTGERIATSEQVASVADDRVLLNVSSDELIRG